ncbi:DUF4347 domain-containing protein [Zoogloea sp.]|uniref:DUF4347 domain-containing protein n=1 Tax=Zoogloea sp. TaxID=49181 RepID=UPI00321FB98B
MPRFVLPRSRQPIKRAPLRPMALEPRLMFDGAAVDTAAQVALDAAAADASTRETRDSTSEPATDAPPSTPQATEIVFITTSTPDWQKLAGNVRAGVEVVLLDPERDGLDQINAVLSGRSGITALHLVSHGADGLIILGNTPLDTDTLSERNAEVASWRAHLASTADILIYGCDVAAGTQGRTLADQLSTATGADVAASSDTTGAAAHGGDWQLEYASGPIETDIFLTAAGIEAYDARLATVSLSGASGWTAIMFGAMRDPDADSQAGAADTDIIGDTTHGSLYTAYSDNGTAGTADDYLYFRMRIDNPTSDTDFSGVAIVGMDANGDGRVDLFMSVDGRNNTRAVRLLDPGTGANISPNTTSTSPLPTGWLPNNGVYAFSPSNYSVDAVSAVNDPHYGPSTVNPATGTATDLTGDGKRDVFISWRVPLADIAAVLAKPSPVDRSGVYGPRGAAGLPGFTKDTAVRYVSFTQTQPGPINGDLNGVGAAYDKNATFAALGAFTAEMTASAPVAASTRLDITDNAPGIANGPVTFTFQFSEGVTGFTVDDISVSGGSAGLFSQLDADTYTLVVTPAAGTASGTIQVDVGTDAARSLVGNLPTAAGSATQAFDTLPPQITIASPATALSGTPTLQGTTDLPDGSLITVTIDPDNDPGTTNNLIYRVVAAGGLWSLDLSATAPVSGSLPPGGLVSYSKVTASATDAAGNTASAVELNPPTVNAQTTSNTTPVVTGTWTNLAGDTLTVSVDGVAYTPSVTGNTWSVSVTNALSPSATPYEVIATVSRGSSVSDTTTGELTISNAPPTVSVDISGGATASGSDTTPVLTGSSANAGGYVIIRLDPNNDGNLSDAVTYSVTPDGGGNWTLDTGSATPISGTVPTGGFIGPTGVRATDANSQAEDTQVLTISTPTITIVSVTSTAVTDANAQVNNADTYINMTEDNAVTISGTAAVGFTVHLVITDANGNSFDYAAIPVDGGGHWSLSTSDIGSLDSTTLTLTASLSGTSVSTTNTSYTHDAIAPRIFITNPSEIKKNGGVLYGGSELANTGLTITIRNDTDTTTVGTWTATTNASGDWSVTTSGNLVSGASGNIIIRVAPTTAPATDVAKNIVGTAQVTQYVAANAVTSSIAIGTIAGDNTITVNEIGSGLAITGTTTLAGSGTVTLAVDDGDAGTGANFTATGSYSGGTWTVNLSKAQIQSLLNGQLTVTASAQDTSASPAITISDVALPTLSLLTPTLDITDDTPGSAAGPVTFTFQFSEGVSGFTVDDITVTNGSKGSFSSIDADTYTLVVTPDADSSGDIGVTVASHVATGTSTGRGNADASATQPFNTTVAAAAPSLTINADALATSRSPVITGTTNLPAGAPIVVSIDPDNDPGTANSLSYAATARNDGTWSVDTASATPTSGSLPADGLTPWARITATATNAYGNSTTVTALDIPAVTPSLSNSSTATVTGTWTNLPGDTLAVLINGTTYSVGNGNLSITGNTWSLTTLPLADGTYHVTATVSRSGPDSRTDLSTQELVIDTVATVDITGGPSILTGDTTPVISGSTSGMPAGTLLTLEIDSDNNSSYDLIYQTTIAPDGSWTVDTGSLAPTSGALPEGGLGGITPVRATATDPAGNQGIDNQTLNIDHTPPEIAFTSGNRTPTDQPLITGTTDLAAGSTITLEIDPDNIPGGPTYLYTAIVQPDGTWRVDTANPGANGGSGPTQSYPPGSTLGLVATATDPAGNSASASRPLVIDANAPTVTVSEPLDWSGTPDGVLDATEDDSVVVRGITTGLADGKTLSVAITDGVTTLYDTATVSGNSWSLASLNLSSLAAGPITVTATHTDDGGNAYADTATINHVRNAVVSIDAISEDTGEVADFITRDDSISIQGTATPGATVNVLIKDASDIVVASFSVPADAGSGGWSTPTTGLPAGTYTLDAEVGGQHALRSMTIVAATAPLLTGSSPADNATGVAVDANLSLSFDRNVRPGSGIVSLYRASDDSLVESYNVSTGLGSLTDSNGAPLGHIAFAGNSLTLNPGTDLDAGTLYYIRVDAGAVIDQAGNAYAGIADSTTVDFRTAGGANQAPVIATSGGSTSFIEGADTASTPVVVDAGLTVSDADNTTLAGATVSLTGNFQSGQDVLAFTNVSNTTMGNISASYDSGTGVLTLSSAGATATLAQWQTALRSVTYTNTSDTPATSSRTVSFSVDDGTDSSTAVTRLVTLTAANDSPAITAPASIGVTEDVSSAITGISLSDPDAGGASVSVTLSVASGGLSAVSGGGVTVGGTASALVLSGSIGNINSFIAGSNVSFLTASNATADVVLNIAVDDNGNTGSGGARTDSTTVTLSVTADNDPPVATASTGNAAFVAGASAVQVDDGITVADVDNTTLASATVSLTGNFQSGQDVLAFTNVGNTTMGNISASYDSGTGVLTLTSAGATATLAQWQAALRSVTYDNIAGSPSTASRTISFQLSDGSASSNSVSRVLTVAVPPPLPVAPQITGPSGGQGAATSATAIPENTLPVTTFTATESVSWSLAGTDAARFRIDASGALHFVSAPDFETPLDVGDGAANNTYVVEVQATDGDGNVATQTVTVSVTDVQEATAPTQTVLIDRMDKDSGASDNDFITADGSAGRGVAGRLSAPLAPDEVVELSFDGGQTWTLATVTGTTWTATDPNVHADSWTLQARVSNPGANLSGPASTRSVTLDTTPPAAPTVDPLSTTLLTPTLTGTAEVSPGERLSVSIDGRTYTDGDGHLSFSGGRWTLQLPADVPLTPGVHSVEARITDLAGNSSADTSRDELVINDVPPPRQQQPLPEPQPIVPPPPLTPPPTPSLTPTVTPPAAPTVLAAQDPVRNDPMGDQQLSNLRQLADDALGDFGIRIRSEGFPIVVLRSDDNGSGATGGATLLINRGIPDTVIEERGRQFEVPIPNDAFAHSRQDAIISLTVTRSNGAPLPGWLQFDPRMGLFRGTPPAGFSGEVEIRVIARDQNGNQVEVIFRIRVGGDGRLTRSTSLAPAADGTDKPARPGFSAQLKQAGHGGQSAERDRLVAQARALAARKATLPV